MRPSPRINCPDQIPPFQGMGPKSDRTQGDALGCRMIAPLGLKSRSKDGCIAERAGVGVGDDVAVGSDHPGVPNALAGIRDRTGNGGQWRSGVVLLFWLNHDCVL